MSFEFANARFSGPLDLLLQLVEAKELPITEIALAEVTEAYLEHLRAVEDREPEEVADFLFIASRLLLLKSKAILPTLVEEESYDDLAKQLKLYKEFVAASQKVKALLAAGRVGFSRARPPVEMKVKFSPPPTLTPIDLRSVMIAVLKRLDPLVKLPRQAIEKTISLREKIFHLRDFLHRSGSLSFVELVKDASNRTEVIVSFLAILELLKERACAVKQGANFGEILIEKTN